MIKGSRRQFLSLSAAAVGVAAAYRAFAGEPSRPAPLSAQSLIEPTRAFLDSLQAPALAPFLADWPAASNDHRTVVPSELPVLRWLPEAQADAPAVSRDLVNDIGRAARSMDWRQTYKVPDIVGMTFLENYGWSEIVGTVGPLASERVACGFLILGPETHYLLHRHEAAEIYVPLAGTALWLQGTGGWQKQRPGAVIYHASNEPHAMRTGTHPLLALYLWRSTNLRQKSQFVL
jgi:hypothetical protein